MVTVPFPGGGVPPQKKATIALPDQDIEEGDFVKVVISEKGIFTHDFADVFDPDMPTGFFKENPDDATPSVIISSPATGIGSIVTLFFVDKKNANRYVQKLTVVSPMKKKTPKKK